MTDGNLTALAEAQAAWKAVLAGMQRFGMESTAIDTVEEFFNTALHENAALQARVASADGYTAAFYDLAAIMDLPAQTVSPAEVWQTQMRPRLVAALARDRAALKARSA